MKHTFVTRLLCRLFGYKVIVNCNHDPYLVRWYVFRTKWVSLFIHKFIRSDEDRALHDHPWSFLVIPIWRGYWEHSERSMKCQNCGGAGLLPPPYEYASWEGCGACDLEGTISIPVRRRVYPILGARYRSAAYRHRVELLTDTCEVCNADCGECAACNSTGEAELPAWSLFFHFRREREWGFHPPEGFTPWQKWWSDKCE